MGDSFIESSRFLPHGFHDEKILCLQQVSQELHQFAHAFGMTRPVKNGVEKEREGEFWILYFCLLFFPYASLLSPLLFLPESHRLKPYCTHQ